MMKLWKRNPLDNLVGRCFSHSDHGAVTVNGWSPSDSLLNVISLTTGMTHSISREELEKGRELFTEMEILAACSL